MQIFKSNSHRTVDHAQAIYGTWAIFFSLKKESLALILQNHYFMEKVGIYQIKGRRRRRRRSENYGNVYVKLLVFTNL